MATDWGPLSAQSNGGQTIGVGSAQDVHTVNDGEKHNIVAMASATTVETLTVKASGDSTGYTIKLDPDTPTVIFNSDIEASGANRTLNVESDGSTARVWGHFREL